MRLLQFILDCLNIIKQLLKFSNNMIKKSTKFVKIPHLIINNIIFDSQIQR